MRIFKVAGAVILLGCTSCTTHETGALTLLSIPVLFAASFILFGLIYLAGRRIKVTSFHTLTWLKHFLQLIGLSALVFLFAKRYLWTDINWDKAVFATTSILSLTLFTFLTLSLLLWRVWFIFSKPGSYYKVAVATSVIYISAGIYLLLQPSETCENNRVCLILIKTLAGVSYWAAQIIERFNWQGAPVLLGLNLALSVILLITFLIEALLTKKTASTAESINLGNK